MNRLISVIASVFLFVSIGTADYWEDIPAGKEQQFIEIIRKHPFIITFLPCIQYHPSFNKLFHTLFRVV